MAYGIRQLVLAVEDLEGARRELEEAFAIEECFRDEGVAKYDLENVLLPVGDGFIELVAPTAPTAPAARYLAQTGSEGGYMVIVQVEDFDAATKRAETAGVRIVEKVERENQVGWHVHPADLPGAIVSFDWAEPADAWHWAGEDWQSHVKTSVVRRLAGAVISAREPERLAERWQEVLGGELDGGELRFDGTRVLFEAADRERPRMTAIELEAADRVAAGTSTTIRGVEFRLI